jgi:hypothetical protein
MFARSPSGWDREFESGFLQRRVTSELACHVGIVAQNWQSTFRDDELARGAAIRAGHNQNKPPFSRWTAGVARQIDKLQHCAVGIRPISSPYLIPLAISQTHLDPPRRVREKSTPVGIRSRSPRDWRVKDKKMLPQCRLASLITSERAPTNMRLKAQVASKLNQLRDTNLRPRCR